MIEIRKLVRDVMKLILIKNTIARDLLKISYPNYLKK